MWRNNPVIVNTLALVCSAALHAGVTTQGVARGWFSLHANPDATTDQQTGPESEGHAVLPLRIQDIRLEPAPRSDESRPSTLLKFDVVNDGVNRLSDLVLEIAIVERPGTAQIERRRRVLAGPFTVRGDVILEPDETIEYEMILQDLSSSCACVANVDVVSVSVQALAAPGSRPED